MTAPGGAIEFDFSGVRVRVRGLPEGYLEALRSDWSGFASDASSAPFLAVAVRVGTEPDPTSPWDPKSMRSRLSAASARYEMEEGTIEVDGRGEARAELRHAAGSRSYVAFLNLLRAALAWRMPSRGGMLLHAAGLVVAGRAFLLVGPENSGKTTWSNAGVTGGATLLGDDVVLLDRAPAGFEALAAPLRPCPAAARLPARFPIAAMLFPSHGAPARLGPVPPVEVYGRILSNLPFVGEAFGHDDRVPAVIEDLRRSVPARTLTFPPDPSFLPFLAAFSTERG